MAPTASGSRSSVSRGDTSHSWLIINDPARSHRLRLPAASTMLSPWPKGTRGVWIVFALALLSTTLVSLVYLARALTMGAISEGEAPGKATVATAETAEAAVPPKSTASPPNSPAGSLTSLLTQETEETDVTHPQPFTWVPPATMSPKPSEVVEVWTVDGNVTGRKIRVLNEDVAVFLGIPYGVSTKETGRFRAPNETRPWCTVLDAVDPGPPCPQTLSSEIPTPYTLRNTSEDCLRLNIWSPSCKTGEDPKVCLYGRPVMVYFYGGDFRVGTNSLPFYDGRYLAALGRVVVAVPNYRVGVFGFPSRPIGGADQNPGLQDMLLALSWLRVNVDSFGGDPNDIVPFGQGAGATAIGVLLAAGYLRPNKGIKKVILSSGSVLAPPWHPPTDQQWKGFLTSLGCGSDAAVALGCLSSKRPEDLVRAQEKFPGVVGLSFPDSALLDVTPSVAMSRGVDLSRVQVLLANTVHEGDLLYYERFMQRDDVRIEEALDSVEALKMKFRGRNRTLMMNELKQLYPLQGASSASVAIDILGDVYYNCPTVTLSDLACGSHAEVRHVILALRPESWGRWRRLTNEASHYDDLPFVFGTSLSQHSANDQDFDQVDEVYSKKVILTWSGFAHAGGASLRSHPPRCHDQNRPSMTLYQDRDEVVQKWRRDQCCALDRYLGYETATSSSPSSTTASP